MLHCPRSTYKQFGPQVDPSRRRWDGGHINRLALGLGCDIAQRASGSVQHPHPLSMSICLAKVYQEFPRLPQLGTRQSFNGVLCRQNSIICKTGMAGEVVMLTTYSLQLINLRLSSMSMTDIWIRCWLANGLRYDSSTVQPPAGP
jgi:hypothetical protein